MKSSQFLQLNDTQRIEYRFKRKEFLDDFRVKMSSFSPSDFVQTLKDEFGEGFNFAKLLELDSISMPSIDLFLKLCAYAQLDPTTYFEMSVWVRKI